MNNSFRLNSLRIEEKHFLTREITLVDKTPRPQENYYTLIVGNNGTGKSRLLGTIARYFLNLSIEGKGRSIFDDGFNYENHPISVIALTSSLSDKFPNDKNFPQNRKDRFAINNSNYHYLGNRNNANAFSSRILLSRALDIMFNNLSNIDVLNKYRYLFDYLQYQPILKIEYRFSSFIRRFSETPITIEELSKYITSRGERSAYRSGFFKTYENSRKVYLPDLCALINKIASSQAKDYQLLINFSKSNIERMNEEDSNYSEATAEFFLLGQLEKLDLFRRMHIKAYKEDNSEFDFHEASSGEVNILSTLISLIPLLNNGCLVLIDEPEISLHPSWQYRYIELLLKIFESFKGCHIVIASHSHFLVSDLPIGNSSVITLINDKGIIKSEMIEGSTFGWSAEDILLNIFNLPTTRNYYLSQLITEGLELLAEYNRPNNRLEAIKSRIRELEPLVKEHDPLKTIMQSIINFE